MSYNSFKRCDEAYICVENEVCTLCKKPSRVSGLYFKFLFGARVIVHNRHFSDSAKPEKAEGHVVIHHLNDDQKALVIRYRRVLTSISIVV